MHILVVDDDKTCQESLVELLSEDHTVDAFDTADDAFKFLKTNSPDLVITDQRMPGMSGSELIEEGKKLSPNTSFILITAHATIQDAVFCLKKGAEDYIMKPFDLDEIEHRVNRVQQVRSWSQQSEIRSSKASGITRLAGHSKAIQEAHQFIKKIADAPSTVLINGPTGTGKEVMATAIHEESNRKKGPFIALNCATLKEDLMESELFGHEKGAFTGADSKKPGKFELANNGTLFLDEIAELSLDVQAKLLRVLQEREFYRVGGSQLIKVDVRVVAATHKNLKELAEKGEFREDLFFRLNVLTHLLPPLSERQEDIPELIKYFWQRLSNDVMRENHPSKDTLEILQGYNYPGNIRELKNIIERLIVLGPEKGEVTPELLPPEVLNETDLSEAEGLSEQESYSIDLQSKKSLGQHLQDLETYLIKAAMKQEGDNQVRAAKVLGLKRGTLQYKLKKILENG